MEERERDILAHVAYRAVDDFIRWLYEECPVNPDDVPRKKLRDMHTDYLKGKQK